MIENVTTREAIASKNPCFVSINANLSFTIVETLLVRSGSWPDQIVEIFETVIESFIQVDLSFCIVPQSPVDSDYRLAALEISMCMLFDNLRGHISHSNRGGWGSNIEKNE